ncbi:MAG: hypothetical protein ACOYNY_19520 [Caldilineaceae bacterium]
MRNVHVRLYKPIAGLLAIALWVISVAIAIAQIVVIRELVMRLYTFVLTLSGAVLDVHGAEFWAGVSLQNFLVVLLAMGVVAFVVATGEYHAKRVGTERSWRLFAWTYLTQLLIFAIAYFV